MSPTIWLRGRSGWAFVGIGSGVGGFGKRVEQLRLEAALQFTLQDGKIHGLQLAPQSVRWMSTGPKWMEVFETPVIGWGGVTQGQDG